MWGAIETRGGLVRQLIASKRGLADTSVEMYKPLFLINNQGLIPLV